MCQMSGEVTSWRTPANQEDEIGADAAAKLPAACDVTRCGV